MILFLNLSVLIIYVITTYPKDIESLFYTPRSSGIKKYFEICCSIKKRGGKISNLFESLRLEIWVLYQTRDLETF